MKSYKAPHVRGDDGMRVWRACRGTCAPSSVYVGKRSCVRSECCESLLRGMCSIGILWVFVAGHVFDRNAETKATLELGFTESRLESPVGPSYCLPSFSDHCDVDNTFVDIFVFFRLYTVRTSFLFCRQLKLPLRFRRMVSSMLVLIFCASRLSQYLPLVVVCILRS